MSHHHPRIPPFLRLGPRAPRIRIMYSLPLHIPEFRHPSAYKLALGIKPLALEQRVKDPEIRLWIHAYAGTEAPPAIVGCEVPVYEREHEVSLAETPVDQQVFGEEGCDGHSGSVGEVAGIRKVAHRGVDEGVACLSGFPGGEVGGGFPGYEAGGRFEGFVHAGKKGW